MASQPSALNDANTGECECENDCKPIQALPPKRRKLSYFPLEQISESFVGVKPDPHCALDELPDPTLIVVRDIVPQATSEQLITIFKIVDKSRQPPVRGGRSAGLRFGCFAQDEDLDQVKLNPECLQEIVKVVCNSDNTLPFLRYQLKRILGFSIAQCDRFWLPQKRFL